MKRNTALKSQMKNAPVARRIVLIGFIPDLLFHLSIVIASEHGSLHVCDHLRSEAELGGYGCRIHGQILRSVHALEAPVERHDARVQRRRLAAEDRRGELVEAHAVEPLGMLAERDRRALSLMLMPEDDGIA